METINCIGGETKMLSSSKKHFLFLKQTLKIYFLICPSQPFALEVHSCRPSFRNLQALDLPKAPRHQQSQSAGLSDLTYYYVNDFFENLLLLAKIQTKGNSKRGKTRGYLA